MPRSRRLIAILATAALGAGAAHAAAAVPAQTPAQASLDGTSAAAGFSGAGGLWGDMPAGAGARPYIRALSVVNGGAVDHVIVNGTPSAPAVQDGDVTAAVAPFNLCRPGQLPAPGQCYASPNRVGITIGYADRGALGTDFAAPGVPLRQVVGPNTVFDLTIRLNTLGVPLRWTWLNGALEHWSATRLGRDDAEIRVRLRPVPTPAIDWSVAPPNGCTATPIRDCAIDRSQGETLSAGLVLSLDDTLDPALTGAAFATRGAISGYLEPTGTPSSPRLGLQIASAHLTASGAPQTGGLTAILPAQALMSLYGMQPADAPALFTAARTGDPGTQDTLSFTRATVPSDGTDGMRVDVTGITFSAPTYSLARRTAPPRVTLRRRGASVAISASAVRACRKGACLAQVRSIASPFAGRTALVAGGRTTARGALALTARAAALPSGTRYVVTLRNAAGVRRGRLVTSAVGTAR